MAEPISIEALAKRAGYILFMEGPERPAATAREVCVLLDQLAAEVRAAQIDAWEGCAAMAAHYDAFDGGRTRWLSSINPYSTTEKED